MKKYTFSKDEIEDEIRRFSAPKKLMKDKCGDSDVAVEQFYDDENGSYDENIISHRGGNPYSLRHGTITYRNSYNKESSLINKQRIIKDLRESSAAPLNKLTQLIAITARDYNPHSTESLIICSDFSKRFRDNSAASVIVDAILIIAETDIKMRVFRTVQQWYDIIMSVTDKIQPVSDEKSKLKAEIFSLNNKVQDLENRLSAATVLERKRKDEIDKWHGSYVQTEAEVSMWRQKYEEAENASKRADSNIFEIERITQENAKLQKIIAQLRNQVLDGQKKLCMRDSSMMRGVNLYMHIDDEAYKKKEKALEDKLKNLQEKLGNESVPLSVLAEGLMDYAEEAGISEAHELFNHLNNLLMNVPAWTKNVPELKKFFKKARKEMGVRNVTITGDHATYNENNNK